MRSGQEKNKAGTAAGVLHPQGETLQVRNKRLDLIPGNLLRWIGAVRPEELSGSKPVPSSRRLKGLDPGDTC